MVNTMELEVLMMRAGISKSEMAKILGLSPMGFYKKMKGQSEFKVSEVGTLIRVLEIGEFTEMKRIFFAENSELNSTKQLKVDSK